MRGAPRDPRTGELVGVPFGAPSTDVDWVTKDGREMALCDIATPHLQNIVRMLQRTHTAARAEGLHQLAFLNGEYALMCAEKELGRDLRDLEQKIERFSAELKSRERN